MATQEINQNVKKKFNKNQKELWNMYFTIIKFMSFFRIKHRYQCYIYTKPNMMEQWNRKTIVETGF